MNNDRYQRMANEIAQPHATRFEAAITPRFSLAGAIGRAKLATGLAPLCYDADAHREITFKVAAEELEKVIDLYEMGRCNRSQQRIAMAVLDDTSCVKSILASAFDNPVVEQYWRHHTKHHGDKPLSSTANGMLHKLIATHYSTIPDVEDLQGKPRGFTR